MVILIFLRRYGSTALISVVGLAFCVGMILISAALVRHSAMHLSGDGRTPERGEKVENVNNFHSRSDISEAADPSSPRRLTQEETDALLFNWLVEAPLSQWLADAFLGEEEEEKEETEILVAEGDAVTAGSSPTPSPSFDNVAGIDFSAMTCAEPIDAVYTWVNGTEPYQRRQLAKWKRAIAGVMARRGEGDGDGDAKKMVAMSSLVDQFARSAVLSNGLNRVAQNRTLLRKFVDELLWLRYLRRNADRLSDDSVSITAARRGDQTPSIPTGMATPPPSALKKDSTLIRSLIKHFFSSLKSAGESLLTSATLSPLHRTSSPFRISPEDEALLELMVSSAVSAMDGDGDGDDDNDDSVNHSGGEATASRFADHDELRYSMRSLVTYGGWVRHVYLVTNGQVPTWLNLSHPKITVITHEQLFRHNEKGRELPTFSSNAIEANLHRIPNLSRRFLYFNDDTLFAAPVALEDFYSPTRGHRIYESWLVPSCAQGCPPQWLGDGQCDVSCNIPSCHYDLGDCVAAVASSDGFDNIEHEAITVQPADFSTQQRDDEEEQLAESDGPTLLAFNNTSSFHDEAARYCFVTYVADGVTNTHLASKNSGATVAANNNQTIAIDVLKSCLNAQVGDGACDEGCQAAPSCAYDAGDCGDNREGKSVGSESAIAEDHSAAQQQLCVASYAVSSSLLLTSIVPKSLLGRASNLHSNRDNDRLIAARFHANAATFLSGYGIGVGASGGHRNDSGAFVLMSQLDAQLKLIRRALRSAESEWRVALQSAVAANVKAQQRNDLLTAAKRDFIAGQKVIRNSTAEWLKMLVSEGVYPSSDQKQKNNNALQGNLAEVNGSAEEEVNEDLIERGFMLEDAEMGLLVKLMQEEGTARADSNRQKNQTSHQAPDGISEKEKPQAPEETSLMSNVSPSTVDTAALTVYSVLFNFTMDFPRNAITVKTPKNLPTGGHSNSNSTVAAAEEMVVAKTVRASTVTSVKFAVEGEVISAMNSETRPVTTPAFSSLSQTMEALATSSPLPAMVTNLAAADVADTEAQPSSQYHSLNLIASASFVEGRRALHLLVNQRVLRIRRTAALVATLSQIVEMAKNAAAEENDRFSCSINVSGDSVGDSEGPLVWTGYDVSDSRLIALVRELKQRPRVHLRSAPPTTTAVPIATIHATLAGDVWSTEQQRFVPQVANKTAHIVDEGFSTAPKMCLLLQRMAIAVEENQKTSSQSRDSSGDRETSLGSTKRHLLQSLAGDVEPASVEFVRVPIRTIKSAKNPLIDGERGVKKAPLPTQSAQSSTTKHHHQRPASLRRQLLSAGPDFFGDSLKHTNMLLTHQYGAQQRRVPAHMVHLIDKEAVEEMWELWEDEMRKTSASRFRSQTNVQFALAHFYHIAHATVQRSFSDFVREDVKVASDLPQPSAWFSYSDEEFQNRRQRGRAADSPSVSSSSPVFFQPTVTTAEEFRRLALLMWDEDLIDPEALKNTANKNKVGVMGSSAVGKTDPPYLDRLQAKERNELLMDYLVKSVETEWTMRSFAPLKAAPSNDTSSSFNASSPSSFAFASRFMSFEEMTSIGPWSGSSSGSFAPPFTETEDLDTALLLRRAQSVVSAAGKSSRNNELPWVAVPFGHAPLALSATSESCVVVESPSNGGDDNHHDHSPLDPTRHIVTPFVDSIYNTELVVVSMVKHLLSDIEESLHIMSSSSSSLSMNTLLSTLWEVEAETHGIVTADETEHIVEYDTPRGDDALPPPRNLMGSNGESLESYPSFMNASLIRQTSFLRMYKGIQPDGTILDLSKAGVGPGGFTFGQGSTRDRERDDALPMTDHFFGKMLWLSHVAALRGDHHHGDGRNAGQQCPSMSITDELLRDRLAMSTVDMKALMAGLGLDSGCDGRTSAPTTGEGRFGRLVGMANRVLKKLHERHHNVELRRDNATLCESLHLLFYLQHAHFTPTQTISLESDKQLSSYLYTNQVQVPVTLSLLIAGLPRGENKQGDLPQHQSPPSSAVISRRIFFGYRSLLFDELFTLNEAVKSFDRQAQAAKDEALAKARAKLIAESGGSLSDEAALLAALPTQPTTEKALSLLEIAAMNNHRWRGNRRRNAGDVVRAAQHAEVETTPAPTVALGGGVPPPYYDMFFEEAMNPRTASKTIRSLEKLLNNTLFEIAVDIENYLHKSPSASPTPLIRGLLKTSLKMAATMKPTEWPIPPPLSSSQLENSLIGAVVIGMSEENAAAGSTTAVAGEGEGANAAGASDGLSNSKKDKKKTYLKPRPKGRSQLPTSLLHQQFLRRTANPFLFDIQKYSSETISVDNPQSSVTFSMIRNNATVVQDQCDHIRHKRPKFLCINDDMDHSEEGREEHVKVLGVLRELFEGYFPKPSPFERIDGVRNNFTRLTTAELRAIDTANRKKEAQLRKRSDDAVAEKPVIVTTTTTRDSNTNLKPPLLLRKLFIAMVLIVVGSSAATIVALALLKMTVKKALSFRKKQE